MTRSERWTRFIESLSIRTNDPATGKPVIKALKYNVAQRDVWAKVREKIDTLQPIRLLILKSRREGISTAIESWLLTFIASMPNVNALITAHQKDAAKEIFAMSKLFVTSSPLLTRVATVDRDTITIGRSRLKVATAGSPESQRGVDLTAWHSSESAQYEHPEVMLATMQCLPQTDNMFSIGVIESTANGKTGAGAMFYEEWCRAERGESDWLPIFLPWHEFTEYRIAGAIIEQPTAEEYALRERFELTDEQLAWRRWAVRVKCHGDEDLANQEYPPTPDRAFVASGRPFFRPEQTLPFGKYIRRGKFGVVSPEGEWAQQTKGWLEVFEFPRPGRQYIIGADSCLPGDEVLLTDRGRLPISEIQVTDRLLSAEGDWTDIRVPFRNWYEGPLIGIRPMGVDRPLWCTPEHPILAAPERANQDERRARIDGQRCRPWSQDAKYIYAKDLRPGMILRMPRPTVEVITTAALIAHWPSPPLRLCWGGRHRPNPGRISPQILTEPDFWWMVGLYLAEGYRTCYETAQGGYPCRAHRLTFCLNPEGDAAIIERLKGVIRGLCGRSPSTVVRARHTCEIVFNSEQCCEFVEQFGHGASFKSLPEWVFSLPEACRSALIHGYAQGDGCFSGASSTDMAIACVSVSLDLLRGMQRILLSLGVYSSIHRLRPARTAIFPGGRVSPTRETWQLRAMSSQARALPWAPPTTSRKTSGGARFDDRYVWLKIGAISSRDHVGYVYNFETKSNNYCSPWMTLHNSMGLEEDDRGKSPSSSAGEVLDMETLEQVAEYDCRSAPHIFAAHLAGIGRFYNTALLVPEIQASGGGGGREVLVYLREQYSYWNIHHWRHPDRLHRGDAQMIGWETNSRTRPRMLARIREVVLENSAIIHSKRLLTQIENFGYSDTGRTEALSGHDDLLFGWGIALVSRHENYYAMPTAPTVTTGQIDWEQIGVHVRHPESPQERLRRILSIQEYPDRSFMEL